MLIINPEEIKDDLLESQDINIIDFDKSSNYRDKKRFYVSKLEKIFTELKFKKSVKMKFMGKYESNSKLIKVYGKSIVYCYTWENGESKFFFVRDNVFITEDIFWLRYYPFLQITNKRSPIDGKYYMDAKINEALFKEIELKEIKKSNAYVIPSHNNHFGHFIGDEFPSLWLEGKISSFWKQKCTYPFKWKRGIEEILNTLCDNFNISPFDTALEKNLNIRSILPNHLSIYLTNPAMKTYLLEMAMAQIRKKYKQKTFKGKQRLLMVRRGKYKTRINNIKELMHVVCSKYYFNIIDPIEHSFDKLIEMFCNAELIIAESGTSTLQALCLSQEQCKVISLIPKRLVQDTDEEMIESGLPYHLIMPHKISFVLGETIEKHSIQSSDLVNYNLQQIEDCINNTLNKNT
ncbi:glycosyltransferase 61 family protein [Synechococcus sp. MIT S1220]|uniref:glycosyltransferase 61 family protein n=1 Tax=Synechococcus sp. MIT S1220 TaxID=3082549 RepID=UPI0039AFF234